MKDWSITKEKWGNNSLKCLFLLIMPNKTSPSIDADKSQEERPPNCSTIIQSICLPVGMGEAGLQWEAGERVGLITGIQCRSTSITWTKEELTQFPPILVEKKQSVLTNAGTRGQYPLAKREEDHIQPVSTAELGKISVRILINLYHHTTKVIFIEYTITPHYISSTMEALFIVIALIFARFWLIRWLLMHLSR